jgi:hypothetical protein
MGAGEKLSVVGKLEIRAGDRNDDAVDGVAYIGDLAALEIDVEADGINFLRRGEGSLLRADGALVSDGGMDLVGNVIKLTADRIAFTGKGRNPVLVVPDPLNTEQSLILDLPDNTPLFPVAAFRNDFADVTPEAFDFGGTTLDLSASGASRGDLTKQYAVPVPDPAVPVPPFWLVGDPAPLPTLGIELRPLARRERHDYLDGAAIYDDSRPVPGADPVTAVVAETRLQRSELEAAAELHREVFGATGEKAQNIRQVLHAAVEDYKRSTGVRRVIGFEFRRYLRNRPSSQFGAFQALEKLDRLFGYHRRSGLAPAEYGRIQSQWLVDITPDGLTRDQLAQAIHPSRYVRGSDILDIFGD